MEDRKLKMPHIIMPEFFCLNGARQCEVSVITGLECDDDVSILIHTYQRLTKVDVIALSSI